MSDTVANSRIESVVSRTKVLFEGDAFFRHTRSGITRYFTELISAYSADASLSVTPLTPYRWVANEHLPHALPGRFREVPLPRRMRAPIFARVNGRREAHVQADVTHHSLYETAGFERWPSARHVCTIYDFTHEMFPDLFPAGSENLVAKREFISRCDALIAISETTARDLSTWHPYIDKPVVVAPLGVSDTFREAVGSQCRKLPERYVLYVGARHPHKNTDLLLKAFSRISRTDPSLHLVLSGAGPAGEAERLAELGISKRTRRVKLSDRDLPSAYAGALAFVFPSTYEGFGLPAIEAMASGCPTIVSSAPALVEVTDGAALVIDPTSPDELAATMQNVIGDSKLRDRLRAWGSARANEFTWQRTARLTARAYQPGPG